MSEFSRENALEMSVQAKRLPVGNWITDYRGKGLKMCSWLDTEEPTSHSALTPTDREAGTLAG